MENEPQASRWRLDQPHRKPPNPHMYDMPNRPEIELLLVQLDDVDLDFRDFSQRLSRFPGLDRYVVAYANHFVNSPRTRVEGSDHASALLGIRGLRQAFEPILEDDGPTAIAG